MNAMPLRSENQVMGTLAVLVTALMVALGILLLAGAAAIRHADMQWRQALADRWTVELSGAAPEVVPTSQDVALAVDTLRGIPGVVSAEPVGAGEVRALLQPLIGDTAEVADLPLPVLIDIRIDPKAAPQASAVADALAAKFPNAKLDDESGWTRDLLQIAQTGEVLGLVFFGAIALIVVVTISATSRARLAVNRAEIVLLHTLGATDRFIVRQFQAGALRSAAIGAGIGAVIAAAALAALIKDGPKVAPLLMQLRLDPIDWAALAAVPAVAILLAVAVAGLAARSSVRRLP